MLDAAKGCRWWEGPLVEIKNSEELEAWLQVQPREVSVAFAARASLRILPIVQTSISAVYDLMPGAVLLPVFRATGVAWAAAKYLAREQELATACRAAAAALVARSTGHTWRSGYATAASRAAEYAAVVTIRDTASADAANAADAAVDAVAAFGTGFGLNLDLATALGANPVAAALWSAVSTDATRVEEGAASSVIASLPLWPQGQPDQLQSLWQEMKAALLAGKDDWQVWTDWYEDRLEGRVRDDEHELAFVQIEEALWSQGPAIVNAEIKRRIEELGPPQHDVVEVQARISSAASMSAGVSVSVAEPTPPAPVPPKPPTEPGLSLLDGFSIPGTSLLSVEAIPEQAPTATNFRINSEGLIDVVPDPPALHPLTDALQRDLYNEVHRKAQAFAELSPNLLGDLNRPAGAFRESLPEGIEELSIIRSWSRGNTLRSRLRAHDLSMSNAEPDPAHLSPLVAEALRDLVGTWNVFIVGDPKGRELDEIRLGPQDVEEAKQAVAAASHIVEALQHSENVATPEAIEAVAEQAGGAKTAPPGIDGDQALDLSRKTTSNFVSELLRSVIRGESAFAWKEYRAGIYRAGGTATAGGIGYAAYNNWPAIVSFVARNADALKEFVTTSWHNPTLVEIIDWVVRTFT